jgi:hypothetical protein
VAAPGDFCAAFLKDRRYNGHMRHALKLHPDSRCADGLTIDVGVTRESPSTLALTYFLSGDIDALRLPPAAATARRDNLWRHTCLEAFARARDGDSYVEFNFAPSTEWAAYRFGGYRKGMAPADEVGAPRVNVRSARESVVLQASVDLSKLLLLPRDAVWRLGLSAVIEEMNGRISYWALAHPPGKPDFHHSDCFALELPPASRA